MEIRKSLEKALDTCRIRELEMKVAEAVESFNLKEELREVVYVYSKGFALLLLEKSKLPEVGKIEQCKHVVVYPALLVALPGVVVPSSYIVFDDGRREMLIEYMEKIGDSAFFVLLSPFPE